MSLLNVDYLQEHLNWFDDKGVFGDPQNETLSNFLAGKANYTAKPIDSTFSKVKALRYRAPAQSTMLSDLFYGITTEITTGTEYDYDSDEYYDEQRTWIESNIFVPFIDGERIGHFWIVLEKQVTYTVSYCVSVKKASDDSMVSSRSHVVHLDWWPTPSEFLKESRRVFELLVDANNIGNSWVDGFTTLLANSAYYQQTLISD